MIKIGYYDELFSISSFEVVRSLFHSPVKYAKQYYIILFVSYLSGYANSLISS